MAQNNKRNRILYTALLIGAVSAGLMSRSKNITLPGFIAEYSGDTIWAMMVFFLFCCIFPRWQSLRIFFAALAFSYAIEFSQFYHAPWLDHIRNYKLGGLILGFGFKFSDLICYTVGISVGLLIDKTISYAG